MAKTLGGMTPEELAHRIQDFEEVAEFEAYQEIEAEFERQAWEDARAEAKMNAE